VAVTADLGAAQQVSGAPGSPSASSAIDGKFLPPQPQPFGGIINPNAARNPNPGGRPALCGPRERPTFC
jgi:arylsulfatase